MTMLEEQWSVVKFLTVENVLVIEIFWRLREKFGNVVVTVWYVQKWVNAFREGCTDVQDQSYLGRLVSVIIPALIVKIDENIQDNYNITIFEFTDALNVSFGTVHEIVRETLKTLKLCARWIPLSLTDA